MDGMLARGILKILVIITLILTPFLVSGLTVSEASSMDGVIFKEPHVSSDNSVLIAGRFHYFDVTLEDDRDNICIIAYVGNNIPDPEDRSSKNYYSWEYDHGVWKDNSGHESLYIDSSKCQKENYTYSFYIGIDGKADKGRWTIKIIVDNGEVSSTSSFIVVADISFFLSAMIGVFEPHIRDKNSLFSSKLICSDRKRIMAESEKDIEDKVDEILRKHAASDQEESTDEILDLFVSDEESLTYDELVTSTVSTYSKSRLKNGQTIAMESLFFNEKFGRSNGFWSAKFAGYNKFLAILVTIIILSVIFVPAITSNNNPPNITVINVQSYPVVGGKWTVMFNTIGTADLTITSVNGTTWSNIDDDHDLRFLEIGSGNDTLDYEWMNNSVFIANYSSNETGYETSKVLTTGAHTLIFSFGDDVAFAHNLASEYWLQTTTSDFNNGTYDNIDVSSNAFYLNGTSSIDNTTLINDESFEGATWPPTGWSATGQWNRESDQAHDGLWSADFDGGGAGFSGDLDSPTMDCSDTANITGIYVDFYYRDEAADSGEFELYYYNGSSWNNIANLAIDTENQWNNYNEKITDSQYFVSNFQIRWSGITLKNKENVYVDLVNVTLEKNLIEYYASGNITSETHDTGRIAPNYTGIIVDNSTPGGTSITTKVRAADTEANLTSATWYTDINQVPNQRWVQWNISLTSDGSQTPTVNEVNLTWNYDNDKPTSSVNIVLPYWQNTTPFEINVTASDTGGSGLKEVALYYNYSSDNVSGWTGWTLYGTNETSSPYNWSFNAPDGDGYYRFYSIAIDNESNVEDPPSSPDYDNISGVDTTDPTSEVDALPQYWYGEGDNPIFINVSSATDVTSGVKNLTLYYRYREDNLSGWGSWGIYGSVDENPPWSWSFNFPDGTGHYEFYSIAVDNASNYEDAPATNDTRCGYSANKPSSEVDYIAPYWHNTSPLLITGQAIDNSGSGLKNVTLYFYNSSDNISWLGPWTYGADSDPWNGISWSFNFPNGVGYYRFYSIAIDNDTNVEDFSNNDTMCGYDTSAPSSQVDTITSYWQNLSDNPLTINVTSTSDDLSGVVDVTLYWYNSTDNSTWYGPWSNGTDSASPYSWKFTFSNGSGYYRFYSIADDAAGNQEDSPVTNDTMCGYDTSAPSSQVDTITSYWQSLSDNPLTINVTNPSDDLSGVVDVTLYWYNSTDNSTWYGPWSNGTDSASPYSWKFTFSNGSGYYRFYSIASDAAGNQEDSPAINDTMCGYDTSAPSSQVDSLSPYWKYGSDNPLTISVTAPSDDLSGVKNITLYYRYREDNLSGWGSWGIYGSVDENPPWSWSFNFPDGTGHYEFYSIAADNASNYESAPATNDTRCGYVLLPAFTISLWSENNSVSTTELTLTSSTNADGSTTGNWASANGKWAKSTYEYWDFTIENTDIIGPIDNATLYLKHNQSGWSDDNFLIQIWNGSSWFNVRSYTAGDGPPTVDTTDSWDVKVLGMDTWDEINAAIVRITGNGDAPPEDTVDWLVDTVEIRVGVQNIEPIINNYNLLNATGSKLNNATGYLDVNNEYYFTINVTDGNGWADISYIGVKAWYDQGSESTTYNETLGGNLNMHLRYENTTGTATYTMLWPDDEAQIIPGNCTETIITETTRIINISFKPGGQIRWAGGDGAWDTTQDATNDQYSWNFNVLTKDNNSEEISKKDEYGVYRYISIQPDSDWVDVYSGPGTNDDSSVVVITYSSNYDFNMSIYFEENLTNTSRAETIEIANNVKINGDADPNDDITTDITFSGIGEGNAVDIFNISGNFSNDDASKTVSVQFNVYIPFGTYGGKYIARVATKIVQG